MDGGRQDDWNPSKNSKICSAHFKTNDLVRNNKNVTIAEDALPVITKQTNKKVYSSSKPFLFFYYASLVDAICYYLFVNCI